jgi:hypothetical protein
MNDPDTDRRQAVALFRYGVIAELLHLPVGGKGLYTHLAERAAREYTIPGSTRNRLAHYALTSAALSQARTVSAEHVQTAREEVAP